VSKHWKPRRQPVALRPSRIRREPVRLEPQLDPVKVEARAREREMWGGVAGVLLFAAALMVLAVGISAFTLFRDDAAATARARLFGQCYNTGPNCVLDGDTIYVRGEKVDIAGVQAPAIEAARCPDERSRGIDAAVRLADLLNRGKISVGPAFRDPFGRAVRKVQVDGEDVGRTMIAAGLAHEYDATSPGWCG
jgi:micrococcal nuclease